jgi:uncharacterized protein
MNYTLKQAQLANILREFNSVVVAFSAGVDSTYLLAVCVDILGTENVLAVTACSPSLPTQELTEAHKLADLLGVRLEIVPTHELDKLDYVSNDAARCYHCKDELFTVLHPIAQAYSLATVVYGATADDVGEYRPGMHAAEQHGARAPLLEADLSKADIRALSQERGLPTHDKPALACLASRIAYGLPVTESVLSQVDQAEAFLRDELMLKQVRVRHHGDIARLEVEPGDIIRLAQPEVRARIVARLRDLGFTYITLDLVGFRSGSMNAMLDQRSRQEVLRLKPISSQEG